MKKIAGLVLLLVMQSAVYGQKHSLIVLHPGPHTIDEIDPATGKILHQLQVADQPHEAAMTPDGKTIYASLPGPGEVVVVDTATLTVKGKIETDYFKTPPHPQGRGGAMSTSAGPHALGINNGGTKLYIGLSYRQGPGVVVYDLKAGKALTKIDLPIAGEFLQIQPKTDKLYYPNRDGVIVIDTKTDKIIKTIGVKGAPTGADFAPNGEVWLSENGDGSVTVIDGKTDEVVKVIDAGGKGASRIAVAPNGKLAAASFMTSEDVILFDTAKKEVIGKVNVGKGFSFPLFSPDSNRLYVATAGGSCTEACPGNVVVVDVKGVKKIAQYSVADDAFYELIHRTAK